MSNVTKLELPLDNLIRKSENNDTPSQSIFFLHGFGSNMQDLFGLSPLFNQNWTCVSLQASIPVQYNGWAWAELDFQNIGKLPKPEQMKIHQEKVFVSIEQCIKKLDLDPKRINLLGFSQGASLSIYSGLKNPNTFNSVVALSGFFPIKEISEQVDLEAVRGLKLFMGHGRLDPVVPIGLGHDTKNGLIDIGVNPNYNEYDSEHTISNECLNDILKWLEERN